MILATDVQYQGDDFAVAGGLLFSDWTDAAPADTRTARIDTVAPYRPGAFYRRELPCLLALLDRFATCPATIVIDGYVTLGADARDGLGAHLFRALGGKTAVIGVAKTRFDGTPADAELLRGQSRQPLYITARGLPQDQAKARIAAMHGRHRIPTLLAGTDRLCRDALAAMAR